MDLWVGRPIHLDASYLQIQTQVSNPLRQTHRHKKVLSKYLGIKESTIQPVISFVGDVEFKTELPVLRSGLSSYIKQFGEVVFSDEEVERITGLLSDVKSGSKISKSEHIQSLKERHSSNTICPKCGSDLVVREVKQGERKGAQFLDAVVIQGVFELKQESGGSWIFTIIVILIVIGIIWWVLN